MLVSKICLTGGPCGGKSSALVYVENQLVKLGYNVIIINEAATELKQNGMINTKCSDIDFATLIVKYQLHREIEAENSARKSKEKYVILSDRSAIEPAVYVGYSVLSDILQTYNKNIITVRDSYDLVLHLTTTAKGAEEYYTIDNNETRTENIEEARKLDDKLLQLWKNHPNRVIISNFKEGFDYKLNRIAMAVIDNVKSKEIVIQHYR